jgi:hypothetical protein
MGDWNLRGLQWALFYPFLILFLIAGPAAALPIVALDLDSVTPGVQSEIVLAVGESLMLDVLISGVALETPVNGFSFDVVYHAGGGDPVLDALSVAPGGFLSGALIDLPESLTPPALSYALGSFGPGDTGDGLLARIEFTALATGSTTLALDALILGQPFPAEGGLPFEYLGDAQVTVIPEPSTFLLLALGLAVLTGRRRQVQ